MVGYSGAESVLTSLGLSLPSQDFSGTGDVKGWFRPLAAPKQLHPQPHSVAAHSVAPELLLILDQTQSGEASCHEGIQ